ncbi:DoxX family protein [Paenibacillus mucilaginosus]|nr:DoxX family protein [Paenibacillus mucilaginosus]MCG7211775.1 DoxX family protein [Paenibacillus mucilaginosus]WDM29873.1 DoxX family protein [Paenibacillus mucilaginosus]
MKKVWRIAGWVGLILVAILFVQAGVLKLIGETMSVEGFKAMGFPDWFRLLIGLLEAVGGVALLFRKTARYAAALLGAIMIGAIVTILTVGNPPDVAFPAVTLVLLVLVGLLRKPADPRTAGETKLGIGR